MKSMKINLFNNYGKISFDLKRSFRDCRLLHELEEAGWFWWMRRKSVPQQNIEARPRNRRAFLPADGDYLGDIFICVEKVFSQAEERACSGRGTFWCTDSCI